MANEKLYGGIVDNTVDDDYISDYNYGYGNYIDEAIRDAENTHRYEKECMNSYVMAYVYA